MCVPHTYALIKCGTDSKMNMHCDLPWPEHDTILSCENCNEIITSAFEILNESLHKI
jgi:hypothetical protein